MKITKLNNPKRVPLTSITDGADAPHRNLGVLGELNLQFQGPARPKGTLHLPR